jgi:N-acetylmuramoyl-L-alanine amidase
MAAHTVRQGDTLGSIAREHGFASWREIYDHADNAALRERRPNPALLFPGDEVAIPEKRPEPRVLEVRRTNRFVARGPGRKIRLVLRAADGKPLAGKRYELRAVPRSLEGTIPDSGLIEHTVPHGADTLELFLWTGDAGPALRWVLRMGHLDPVDTLSGAQARLRNLGYDAGSAEEDSLALRAALQRFQEAHGLEPDGELAAATRSKLAEVHGC